MENSAYMPTSLASPALMVLASTAEASRESLHVQGTPAFPGQTMDTKEMHIPFSFSMRSLYGQPDSFPGISGHSLHLHNPFLSPGMERGLSFINPTGGGAFRPVSTTTADDRNGFHSAFLPTTAKGSKLDQVTASSFSHAICGGGGDVTFTTAIGRSGSPLCVKEESSDKETTSSLELQDRLTETPASDLTDGTERSTPDEGRSLRRSKKRHSLFDGQGCCCPVCGVTLRAGEVELHFIHEAERLHKIGRAIKKSSSKDTSPPKVSLGGSSKKAKESSSNSGDKNSPESRWESYQRVKANRQNRLSARAKGKKRKQADETTICPVCNERLTGTPDELNGHVEHCLRKREADEDEQVDVEGETYEEYEWAGQTRIRATTLLQGGFAASGFQTSSSRSVDDQDIDLNVDVDDTDTYGQPQYNEADVIPCSTDEPDEEERQALRGALIGATVPCLQKSNHWYNDDDCESTSKKMDTSSSSECWNDTCKNISASSAETTIIIESLKTQLRELESQSQQNNKFKCLICMNPYMTPLVSVICWHVHCENCWLLSLGAKKLCPQCKSITSPQDLRRLYL